MSYALLHLPTLRDTDQVPVYEVIEIEVITINLE